MRDARSACHILALQKPLSSILVGERGLEPPHPERYSALNATRLPIPPLAHISILAQPPIQYKNIFYFLTFSSLIYHSQTF